MTKTNHLLDGQKRTVFGKKVRHLRKEGFVPATMYGHNMDSISIQFKEKDFLKVFSEVGESGLVELNIDGEKYPILFKNPQYHPMEGNLIHIDCYKVNLKEKITATVPIELIGESLAVKEGKVLVEVTNEVEVEALPTDLPEKIEVDISILISVDQMITVADLKVESDKVVIVTSHDQVIVKIEEPRIEEEAPVAEEVAPGDVPAMEQKTPEELEAQAKAKTSEDKEEK